MPLNFRLNAHVSCLPIIFIFYRPPHLDKLRHTLGNILLSPHSDFSSNGIYQGDRQRLSLHNFHYAHTQRKKLIRMIPLLAREHTIVLLRTAWQPPTILYTAPFLSDRERGIPFWYPFSKVRYSIKEANADFLRHEATKGSAWSGQIHTITAM